MPAPHHARASRAVVPWLAVALLLALALASAARATELPSRPGTVTAGSVPPSATSPGAAPRGEHVAIRRGERGQRVALLQRRLRAAGLGVRVDGRFGRQTLFAVRRVQRRLGLSVTGIATPELQRQLGVPAPIAAGSAKSRHLVTFPMPKWVDYRYFDDFSSPRGTGPHGATDILAPHGTPILASTHGMVIDLSRTDNGLGGITIYIRDPAGDWYYYAHLSSISPGLREGDVVWPGRVIGRNGASGNASYGAPHLHFEIMKGKRGGPNVNPFSHLVAVDPKPRSVTRI